MRIRHLSCGSIVSAIFLRLSAACFIEAIVETPLGEIQGSEVRLPGEGKVLEFLGVPYAKPPVGHLRFRKPEPVEPWGSRLHARRMKAGCVQHSAAYPFPWLDNLAGSSEDCLYLNVWVPRTGGTASKKSVMFWIHTGGFTIGSSRLKYFDGSFLALLGDVIVVTTNYRLGVQGFLYSGTEDAPGNMGIWDLVESLKWVRNNIESFGGDKDSITIFGNSAGGIAIGMFCTSPVTRGLFQRAIMQSGSPTILDGKDNGRNFRASQQVAQEVGCAVHGNALKDDPEKVVRCLRGVDSFRLSRASSKVTAGIARPYYPQFGDELLPKDPRQAIVDGDFSTVDLLIGSNDGDGSIFLTKSRRDVFGFFGEKCPLVNATFGGSIVREFFKGHPDPDAIVRQYLGGLAEDDHYSVRRQVLKAFGDFSRVCPSVYFAEIFAAKGARVYYYFFIHHSSNMPWAPWMLSVHFDETPFAFGFPVRWSGNYTRQEGQLSMRMVQAWSSFAKTGIPSAGKWPLYSKENPAYQVLDVNTNEIGYGPHRSNCDFFRREFGI